MAIVKFGNGSNVKSVDQMVNDLFNPFFGPNFRGDRFLSKMPAVNVAEDADAFFVEIAAPGLSKEDFKISLESDVLTISAEKKVENQEDNKKYSRKEFGYHAFSKSFTLPDTVDADNVAANYEDGVLKLHIAKKEAVKIASRLIEVA